MQAYTLEVFDAKQADWIEQDSIRARSRADAVKHWDRLLRQLRLRAISFHTREPDELSARVGRASAGAK